MNNTFTAVKNWFVSLYTVWRHEFSAIFGDVGIMLFFFALPLFYPIVYTLIYNPEMIKDMAVVVVDNSRTAESRRLARMFDASEFAKISGYAASLDEAKTAWKEKKCYAILEIPADYAKNLGRGEQAHVTLYNDMSLLFRYRQFTTAATEIQLALATDMASRRMNEIGLAGQNLAQASTPFTSEQNFTGDPTQGFASFIMPGIIVLILQQSLILGICMIAATGADRRRRNHGYDPMWIRTSPSAIVLGKTLCYVAIYIPLVIYVLHFIPWIFSLPHYGSLAQELLLMVPFLLACCFFGQTVSVLVPDREATFLVIVFTSVIFLFLSGLTWPRYAMNEFWQCVGDSIPSTWGVEGFVQINSDNASLYQQSRPYHALWIQTAVYFLLAIGVTAVYNRLNSPVRAKR